MSNATCLMISIFCRCINESHVFVVVSGGFSGFCLWLDYHLRNGAVLQFRAIQRLGMDHVREEFYRLFKEALSQVLLNLRWFYLLYIVFGEIRVPYYGFCIFIMFLNWTFSNHI